MQRHTVIESLNINCTAGQIFKIYWDICNTARFAPSPTGPPGLLKLPQPPVLVLPLLMPPGFNPHSFLATCAPTLFWSRKSSRLRPINTALLGCMVGSLECHFIGYVDLAVGHILSGVTGGRLLPITALLWS